MSELVTVRRRNVSVNVQTYGNTDLINDDGLFIYESEALPQYQLKKTKAHIKAEVSTKPDTTVYTRTVYTRTEYSTSSTEG